LWKGAAQHVRGLALLGDGRRQAMLVLSPAQPAVDGPKDLAEGQVLVGVQLGRETHLDIADALMDVVPGQLVGDALQGLGVLHDGAGQGKAVKVLGQAGVVGAEDQLVEAFNRLGGELHPPLAGQLDQGRLAQRAVEMDMQVGLRKGADHIKG
jgi:hypothetical protein